MPQKKEKDLHLIRHSLAHLLAAAVLELWPDTKIAIGPAIEEGFYYDFDFKKPVSESDLPKIEAVMRKILRGWDKFQGREVTKREALKFFGDNPYKKELIEEISAKGEDITFYTSGKFTDLCRGGHVVSAKEIDPKSFKLISLAGAYWRGSEKNPMLTRIYAAAFKTKKELDQYLKLQEEAKRRDHRKLGPQLELFMFHETAPGLPYWLPKGLVIYNELVNFWRKEHQIRDYQEIVSPLLNKKELYVTSGHYEHFWQDMFTIKVEREEYGVKAMNCPNAMIVFASKSRSYKDLPLRLSDTDTLHRNEPSGTLNGLFRVREFRQDDSHIFVTEDQIVQEYKNIFEIVERFYSIFGLEYSFRLGIRPESFLGDKKTWNKAEQILTKILQQSKRQFIIGGKEGAFYGPKVDILMKDALGREWQMGTIQLDFQQPRRFKLEYTAADGSKKTPIAIHRVIYGSLERFIGILIEHCAGAFPTWLAPIQVTILPISDELNSYAKQIEKDLKLQISDLRTEFDDRSESIGKKIREAELKKIPYMLIVGKKEAKAKTISVRKRGEKDLGEMKLERFIARIEKEIETKSL